MPNLIVSYDLPQPGQKYAEVEAYIKRQGPAAKLLETVWYMSTAKSAQTVRDELVEICDENDKIVVGVVEGMRGWRIPAAPWSIVTQTGGTHP